LKFEVGRAKSAVRVVIEVTGKTTIDTDNVIADNDKNKQVFDGTRQSTSGFLGT
jgi:hypothetical protein